MHRQRRVNDCAQFFISDLTSRIVAKSGIPTDRYHLGKMILQSLKDAPDYVLQIDGGTNESESSGSVLERSVQCANALRIMGLQRGDVVVLMAPNHLDIAIPFYAALYLGIIIAPIDRFLTVKELYDTFTINKPKLVLCQSEKIDDVEEGLKEADVDSAIVTFDKGSKYSSFSELLLQYGSDTSIDDFEPEDFDTEETIAVLIPTSGTTGLPKQAANTHKNFGATSHYFWSRYNEFPPKAQIYLVVSPLQWLTAIVNFILNPIIRYTRLQSSLSMTQEHAYYVINTYKPTCTFISPTMMTTLVRRSDRHRCDFTSFQFICMGGSAVPQQLLEDIKAVSPATDVFNMYGMSETSICPFYESSAAGSCGKPLGHIQIRIINIDTQEDITEPNTPGELWLKGPSIFKGYYGNPEATNETFAEDRWFKTGDMFYRDESWNFFFVERIKLLFKYKNHQISPVEVEGVIRQHAGVQDVAVTAVQDQECGDLIVACVVCRPGHKVSAQEVKDLVKDTLTDTKQLRGGVVFLDEIPMTVTTKVHRRKLREMVVHMKRQ